MKALAIVAISVLACAIVPSQAFSDSDYNWRNQTQLGKLWLVYSNSTMSFGFSNGTRDDDPHHNDHEPKCAPHDHGKGMHKGEKECNGADPGNGKGRAWGKILNQVWKNFTSPNNQGPVIPGKNRQGFDQVVKELASIPQIHANGCPKHLHARGTIRLDL